MRLTVWPTDQSVFPDYELKNAIYKDLTTTLMSCILVGTSVRVSISYLVLEGTFGSAQAKKVFLDPETV